MGPCGSQWLMWWMGLQNPALASVKLHHPLVNLFWERGGRRMETWLNGSLKRGMKQWLFDPHAHTLFLSCKGFTQYSAKAQPVALYTPFFTSVLPPSTAHAPVSYSQPESGSLCLWPLSALQQFLSLCPSSPVAKVGPVDKPLLDTDLYFSEQGLCSLFQIASYKTSLK